MAKNVSLMGANYPDVPAVVLPQTGGGSATFTDVSGTTATDGDVLSGKSFFGANGVQQQGSLITHAVYDGLDSTSADDALSANQGRVLNNKITSTVDTTSHTYFKVAKNACCVTLQIAVSGLTIANAQYTNIGGLVANERPPFDITAPIYVGSSMLPARLRITASTGAVEIYQHMNRIQTFSRNYILQ